MALKQADKPMLPAEQMPAGHVQCADDDKCRKPGRMHVEGMDPKKRICVEHYYSRLDREKGKAA